MFQFALNAFLPFTGHHWERPGSIFFSPSHQMFMYIDTPWHFSSPSLHHLPFVCQVLQSFYHLWPVHCSGSRKSVSLLYWEPSSRQSTPEVSAVLRERKAHLPRHAGSALSNAAFAVKTCCWLTLGPPGTPGPFLQSWSPAGWPQPVLPGVIPPQGYFPLLDILRFLLAWISLQRRVCKLQYWSPVYCISILGAVRCAYKLNEDEKEKSVI